MKESMTASPTHRSVKFWIPFPAISPFDTFVDRALYKWKIQLSHILGFATLKIQLSGSILGLTGCRIVGVNQNLNNILKLNRTGVLGDRGKFLELPHDSSIFKSVRLTTRWELEESNFLANGLIELAKDNDCRTALLDIGANAGLVAIQALNLSGTAPDVHCFEPLNNHVDAIRVNIKCLRRLCKFKINEFALGDRNGVVEIFTELENQGNSSLFRSVVPQSGSTQTSIKMVDTEEYFRNNTFDYTAIVLKCDTQGYDARILSRIPQEIWQKIKFASIEVWALDEIAEADVEKLLTLWSHFKKISWDPQGIEIATLQQVKEFWLRKDFHSANLFLRSF